MLNKKLGLFALSIAALGLVACNNGGGESKPESKPEETSTPSETSQSGDLPAVPTEEGKITIFMQYEDTEDYIKLEDIPDFCSLWLTGDFVGWATAPSEGCIEMQLLENTNIFYAMIPEDATIAEDLGYHIILGYNSKSGLPDDQQGINPWDGYKTVYAEEHYGGGDHPRMFKRADNLYEAANDDFPDSPMCFENIKPEPTVVEDISLKFKVEFDEDLQDQFDKAENLEIVAKGDHDNGQVHGLQADEEGYYTLPLGDVIANAYQFSFGVRNKIIGGMDDIYNLMHVAGTGEAGKGGTYTEYYDEEDPETVIRTTLSKFQVGINALYEKGTVIDIGTFTNPDFYTIETKDEDQKPVYTVHPYELPSDEAPLLSHEIKITLKHTGEQAFDAFTPALIGGFVGENAWSDRLEMLAVEPGQQWEFVFASVYFRAGVTYEFKIVKPGVTTWDNQIHSDLSSGNFELKAEEGKSEYTISADLSAFAEGQVEVKMKDVVYDKANVEKDIHVRLKNTGEVDPEHVCIIGNPTETGWTTHIELQKSEEGYWEYVIPKEKVYLGITDDTGFDFTPGDWTSKVCAPGGKDIVISAVAFDWEVLEIEADLTNLKHDGGPIEYTSYGWFGPDFE